MLPWKLRKCQILPVNQNLSSVYFSLAKFQLVRCNPSLAMIWQMTCTHKLPKLCSATLSSLVIESCSWDYSSVFFGATFFISCYVFNISVRLFMLGLAISRGDTSMGMCPASNKRPLPPPPNQTQISAHPHPTHLSE